MSNARTDREAFEKYLCSACKMPHAPKWEDDHYANDWIEERWQGWQARGQAEPLTDRRHRFAGWFREVPSAMSYRLWEQMGADQQPGDVALYED
jgi:hypothetical protein